MKQAEEMEALGGLAATLAHEFNNILMPVIAYPELMLRQISEDDPFYRQLVEIREAGERAFTVVQELCELNHRDELLTDALRPEEVVKEFLASANFQTLARQYDMQHVKTAFDSAEGLVSGSSRSISLVIGKMLFHAARRVPVGGEVMISTRRCVCHDELAGEYIVLGVRENGPVMSGEAIAAAFDSHPPGQELFGLGLPVLYGMVKNLNGHVRIESDEVGGTELQVYLPVYFPYAEISPRAPGGAGDVDLIRGRVLVVDDMPRQRDIAVRYLSSFGYHVDTVANGDEALAYLQVSLPCLIMLDMVMPGHRDGLDTYAEIVESHPDLPVIIVSGYGPSDRIQEALELGARGYLQKPYVLEALQRVVVEHADQQA